MKEGVSFVFVYGTLREGASNHWRMEGAEFVGEGSVSGALYRIGWYPGLVMGGATEVRGEVYRVDAEKLAKLDDFEGCGAEDLAPHEYRRVEVEVRLDEGTRTGWAWEFISEIGAREAIESGDWLLR